MPDAIDAPPSPVQGRYPVGSQLTKIKDLPTQLQPREIFDQVGAQHCSVDILLAVILGSGVQGLNVLSLSRDLLQDYTSVTGLASQSVEELASRRGLGPVKARVLKAALELGRRMSTEKLPERHKVSGPEDVVDILREYVRSEEQEVVWVLLLDTKNQLKRPPQEVTRGLVDSCLVHPREVFKEAIRTSCSSVVLAHNHPSGDPHPSQEDIVMTRRLIEASQTVDIPVLDHVVIGRGIGGTPPKYCSLRETGRLEFERSR